MRVEFFNEKQLFFAKKVREYNFESSFFQSDVEVIRHDFVGSEFQSWLQLARTGSKRKTAWSIFHYHKRSSLGESRLLPNSGGRTVDASTLFLRPTESRHSDANGYLGAFNSAGLFRWTAVATVIIAFVGLLVVFTKLTSNSVALSEIHKDLESLQNKMTETEEAVRALQKEVGSVQSAITDGAVVGPGVGFWDSVGKFVEDWRKAAQPTE